MKKQFRLGIAYPDITLAAPRENLSILEKILDEAENQDVDLLFFPPLTLTGDGLGEMNRHPDLLDGCKEAVETLTKRPFPYLLGLPIKEEERLFSVMAAIEQGKLLGYIPLTSKEKVFSDPLLFPKANLPYRDLFEISVLLDDGFSTPDQQQEIIQTCKDHQGLTLYLSCPQSYTTSGGVHSARYLLLEDGDVIAKGQWEEGLVLLDLPVKKGSLKVESYQKIIKERAFSPYPFLSSQPAVYEELLLHQAKAYAYRLKRTYSKHSIIGISGGLDSTWALVAAIHAHREAGLPLENIHAVVLPGFGSSEDTMRSALDLLEALKIKPQIISIEKAVMGHFGDIGHDPENRNVVYENAQARERTQILMNLANAYNGLVIGTGDMSEIALGWSTYNGDQMSMYGINAGIPKTLIQDLILWYARREGGELAKALLHILGRPISPELLPPDKEGEIVQKTEEIIGKYEVIDFILYYTLKFTPIKEIFLLMEKAFPSLSREDIKENLLRFYKRFVTQQFKRTASPHGVKLTEPSLVDFDMASDLNSLTFVKEIESL